MKLALLVMVITVSGCLFKGSSEDVDMGPMADMGADVTESGDMSRDDGDGDPDGDRPPDMGDCPAQPGDELVLNVAADSMSDGSCDCTCTLRDALAAVAPDGRISFDAATSELDASATITTSGIEIDGGTGRTAISGDVDGALLSIEDTVGGVTLSGLDLDGGKSALTIDGAGHLVRDVTARASEVALVVQGSEVTLDTVSVRDSPFGAIVSPRGEDVTFESFTASGGTYHGLLVMAGLGAVAIRGCEITSFGGHGIYLKRSNTLIENSVIAANALHGILIDSQLNPPNTEIAIRGNELGRPGEPNGLSGVEVVRAGDITVGGNDRPGVACTDSCNVIGPNGVGIHIQSATEAVVSGNFVGVDYDGATPRPNGTGIIVGSQALPSIDGENALTREGFVRRGIGGACVHSGDCVRDADFDGNGDVDQYGCVGETLDLAAQTVAFPGGMCTGGCTDNGDCAGGVCVGQLCFAACDQDSACRGGYTCFDGACRWSPGDTPPTTEGVLTDAVERVRIGAAGVSPQSLCDGACNVVAGNGGDGINVVLGNEAIIGGNLVGAVPDAATDLGNGMRPDAHQGIALHAPANVGTNRATVRGNVVGSNTGVGVLVRAPADVTQNWIGLAPDGVTTRTLRIGMIVGSGVDDVLVNENTFAGMSLYGMTIAQGATNVVVSTNTVGRDAAGDVLSVPFDTGIRVVEAGTQAQLLDNDIASPSNHGITVGVGTTRTSMDGVVARGNEVVGGAAVAGIEVYGCTNCTFENNLVVDTRGPGLLVGDPSSPDFGGTAFETNTFRLIGDTAGVFESAIVFLGGTNATFDGNLVENPTDAGFVVGTGADTDMSGTRFLGNTITRDLSGFAQGPGFRLLSGYGATIEANRIDRVLDFGIDFVDALNAPMSFGLWQNVITDVASTPIDFDGAGDDDALNDPDNGANTLLNAPSFGLISAAPLMITANGTANFADARIDVYRTDDTFDFPFEEHLGTCFSQAAGNTPEPFACTVPRPGIAGPVVNLQATASGRHFVVMIPSGSVMAGTQISATSTVWGTSTFTTTLDLDAAALAAVVASSLRASYPEILASESTTYCPAPASACVHIVSGANESAFTVSGGTITATQDRGWVTSRAIDGFTAVP